MLFNSVSAQVTLYIRFQMGQSFACKELNYKIYLKNTLENYFITSEEPEATNKKYDKVNHTENKTFYLVPTTINNQKTNDSLRKESVELITRKRLISLL